MLIAQVCDSRDAGAIELRVRWAPEGESSRGKGTLSIHVLRCIDLRDVSVCSGPTPRCG